MQSLEIDLNKVYDIVHDKYKNEHQKRFKHIVGVMNMVELLAGIYNVDITKAKCAALIHDYYKYEDLDTLLSYIKNDSEKEECKKFPFLAHAYASANALYDIFNIYDEEIYMAIHSHVFGRPHMSRLEEIITIADFTEEGREYEDSIKCRDILLNEGIDEAIVYFLKSSIAHVEKAGGSAHPDELIILKEYEEKLNVKNNN